jgi:hypothetical protein
MLLDQRKHAPFSSPDWLFELKYVGYRMLAEFGQAPPARRPGKAWTAPPGSLRLSVGRLSCFKRIAWARKGVKPRGA